MRPGRTRWRGWRWIKRGTLGAVAVIVLAVVAAIVAVHTGGGREVLRARIEHQLNTVFTGGASLGRIDGSPFGELTLHDVVIRGPDRRPAISVKRLTIELGLLPLLSHQARVAGILAEDVDIDLARDASGELAIKHLLRPSPASRWSIALPKVAIRRGHVRFDTGTEVMNLDALALDARATLPHDGPIDAGAALTGTWRERAAAGLDLRVVLHADKRGLALPSLSVRAGDVSLTGGHITLGAAEAGHAPVIGGTLTVDAGAAAVARLVPDVRLPADIAVTLSATPVPGQRWTDLAITGRVGETPLRITGAADLEARQLRGELSTGTLDVTRLTSGRLAGHAATTIVFDVRPGGPRALPIATATIRGWAAVAGVPRTTFEIALRSAGERVCAVIDATGEGGQAKLGANLRVLGDLVAIEDATLHVTTSDPARASGGNAPVHGALRVDLAASGTLRPAPSLAIAGTIEGRHLRVMDLSAASLHVTLDAQRLPNRPLGHARVELVDLVRGEMQLGALTVDAADRRDGKIAVQVRSRPKQAPWLIDADALVTPPGAFGTFGTPGFPGVPGAAAGPPDLVAIDLEGHRVRTGGGVDWTGHTGHLEISPARIVLRDLETTSPSGHLVIAGSYERAGHRQGDLAANLDIRALALEGVAGGVHGKVDTHVALARRGGAWQGEVQLDGTGLSIDRSLQLLDAHAVAALHGTQLTVTANVSSAGLGRATLALDLETPRVITRPAAWQRLGRDAIRTAELTLQGVDIGRVAQLADVAGEYAGRIEGSLQVSAATMTGHIAVRDLAAPPLRGLGAVRVDLDVSQATASELTPALTATAEGIGTVSAQAQLAIPDRLFDPAAWTALGRAALRGAHVRAEDLTVDPALLDRLGVRSDVRARVSATAEVGPAGRTVTASIDIAGLRGAPIVQPLAVHLAAASDDRATTSSVSIRAEDAVLFEAQGRLPLAIVPLIERWRRDPAAARATPLTGTATLAGVSVPRLLAVFGRTEVIAGLLDGSIELGGTLGAPTVNANLVATGLQVPPGPGGKPIRTVQRLAVTGRWDGRAVTLQADGVEADGGKLQVALAVAPAALRTGTLTIKATKFDLVPILAFAPGPAGAAAGQLDANLTVTGLDLRTTRIAGELHLLDGRVPIAPAVGTLRRAKIDAVIADHEIQLLVDGKLGRGHIAVTGSVALDGASPNGGKAKITLREVSPIGAIEPRISAEIAATLSHDRNQWHADLVVDQGSVVIPDDRGEPLKPPGAPPDMTFATGERLTRLPLARQAPANPIFLVKIDLRSTRVKSEEFRGLVRGKLELRADGEAIGMFGGIEADHGDLDLFGRRYYVDRAGVRFDGSLDPLLDLRITHDFSDVTTITEVHGRASKPELTMSSDPGTYTQGELLGFLLGGEPGGDAPGGSATDRVAGAGESFVANKIGGYVRKALPVNIDVLRYEAASASSSAAVTVGTWLTHELFLAYRQHLEARPDENSGEGELEYWLSRRVVVEGTAGDRGYNGVDLLWQMRY
jgi:translocation-and-assembly-module (TAM) inner membrane subunit TamB-like protein